MERKGSQGPASSGDALDRLPPRRADSHKGDYGRALLIGGARGMSGAIALAGMAALRSGAGLVRLAVPDVVLDVVAGIEPSYMTSPLACDQDGRIAAGARKELAPLMEEATVVACGPGLGRSEELVELVGWLYSTCTRPMVVDADALFALSHASSRLDQHAGPRIMTPHPGEFMRLLRRTTRIEASERVELAQDFAQRNQVVLILKGRHSVVTDGAEVTLNATGNPGMATGGTGDVLTGIVAAMLCQGLAPLPAARLGAHVHGLAGDLAAAELGQVSLIASDLVRYLPAAFQRRARG